MTVKWLRVLRFYEFWNELNRHSKTINKWSLFTNTSENQVI